MASRTYLASFSHTRLSARVTHSTVYQPSCRRLYATATATASAGTNKNRPPSTAKKTHTTEHLSSASNPKLSVKTASRTHVSAGGPPAKAAVASSKKAVSSTPGRRDAAQAQAEKQAPLSQEEQMASLEQMLLYQHQVPHVDIWGQKAETLDVMVPHRYRLSDSSFSGLWSGFWSNRLNDVKNVISMSTLASHNAFPGVNTSNDGFWKKFFQWPLFVFGTGSTSAKGWIAPMRKIALDTYLQLNTAIARNDIKEIKRLTTSSFLTSTLLSQKKRLPQSTYMWRFHREITPTQIVSLRVTEGNLAPEEPKFGNRLMVHALVKFDTEQSLEIYDRRGQPLHTPASSTSSSSASTSPPSSPSSSSPQSSPASVQRGSIPAEKQHVIQYLVLEKRMWYDGPWVIREQIWEVVPKKA